MRISKRLLFVLVPVLLLFGAGTIAFAAGALPFTDIAGHWAQDSIVKEAARGVVQGHDNGTFGPDEFVTRAQVVTFLDRFNTGITCTECHNATTVLTGKEAQYGLSVHGAGTKGPEVTVGDVTFATPGESAFELSLAEGTRKDCSGCHSGNGFSDRIAAGLAPDKVAAGQTDPTRVDCRACHNIHTTNTAADWSLETAAPVNYYAKPNLVGKTFNGGAGNLCASCHQPRVGFPAADAAGNVAVTNSRFGPHHGPQSAMLQGVAGVGAPDQAGTHYSIADTCVTCHMGAGADHRFEPQLTACVPCHGANMDFASLQAEVKALGDTLNAKLLAAGMIDASGMAVVGSYPEAKAAALWDYRTVIIEDKSMGVHNPNYAKALLNAGIAAF